MKNVISALAWVSVIITMICLILTMLTTYGFVSLRYFSNYYTFQLSVIITMFIWSVKEIYIEKDEWINSLFYLIMGFGTMFFMFLKVY